MNEHEVVENQKVPVFLRWRGSARPILRGAVNFPVMLAPMVGLSHVALRVAIREYLPAGARTAWPTEMLNSRRLPHERFELVPETLRGEEETDMVPQILGNDEEAIRRSVLRLEGEWGASGVDINMGCPVRKALAHNYGVSLMGDKDYAASVVAMTKRHTALPVSVKLRAGKSDTGTEFLIEFARGLVAAGAETLTLHPRAAEQKRRGLADWDQIRILRENVDCAVIGNGDVQTSQDVIRMLGTTSCDAVMIGRALTARPWLLWQVAEDLTALCQAGGDGRGDFAEVGETPVWSQASPPGREGERAPRAGDEEAKEYARFSLKVLANLKRFHPEIDKAHWSEELLIRKFRFFLKNSCPWLYFGHELQARASKAKSLSEMEFIVSEFFYGSSDSADSHFIHTLSERTDLRY